MSRFTSIIGFSLMLVAATLLAFSSCNVSRKGGSSKKGRSAVTEQPAVVGETVQGEVAPEEIPEPAIEFPETTPEAPDGSEPTEIGESPEAPEEDDTDVLPDDPEPAQAEPEAEEIPYDEEPTPEGDSPEGQDEQPAATDQDQDQDQDQDEEADSPEPDVYDIDDDPEETTAGTYVADSGEEEPKMKIVDYEADIMRPINITDDSTALNLLGNVVFYHNGAVITCDSAVRYSDKRMDFFKRVIINNGTTYVYGDRAEYNGDRNTARVFAPIVKMVDEDAVLYTYRFVFNTMTNIGQYGGGGVLTQNDNHLESVRGYYNTDTREFTAAGEVELTNPDYKLVSDSIRYNLDTETAEFFTPSQIWNAGGDILLADRGIYRSAGADYEFTRNSYILTDQQEIWADTIRHFAEDDYTILRRDIQIIDEENNSMAFGDYGEYYGETEHGMLTLDPSLISFDPDEPADTLYMRSDSMFFYSYDWDTVFFEEEEKSSDYPSEELIEDDMRNVLDSTEPETEEGGRRRTLVIDEDGNETEIETDIEEGEEEDTGPPEEGEYPAIEATGAVIDPDTSPQTLENIEQVLSPDQPDGRNRRSSRKERKSAAQDATPPVTDEDSVTEDLPAEEAGLVLDVDPEELPEGSGISPASAPEEGAEEETPDSPEPDEENDTETEETEAIEEPEPYISPYAGFSDMLHKYIVADSAEVDVPAAEFWLRVRDEMAEDSLARDHYYTLIDEALLVIPPDTVDIPVPVGTTGEVIDILIAESVAEKESALRTAEPVIEHDSLQRVFYGYRDVRIFREDFQAVCDSIVGFSKDSTMHLHIDPVLWTEENQVTSDVMVIFTRDEQLYKAEFSGSPFMASEVDSTRYNQIKGRFMVSWFRDNTLYRHDVFGNGQNYYYMEDEASGEIDGFMTVECADITYYIEDNTIDEIVWRGEPVYWIYPLDMIPPDVDEFLPGFKWEAHRRPLSKEEVHNRPIRARRRTEVLSVPQPTFPITAELDATRERYIRDNIWRDRNDRLSTQALDFIRDMEIKYAEELLELRSE